MDNEVTRKGDIPLFFKALALFLVPFLLVLTFPFFVFLTAGEFTTPDRVILAQLSTTQPVLYGAAYTDCSVYYKVASVLVRHPEVIVLGASRVMQFRSGFFKRPESFFNAGGAAGQTEQFSRFLDKIPVGQEPKVILVGLDQFTFSRSWDTIVYNEPEERRGGCEKIGNNFLGHWTAPYLDFFQHKFSLADLVRKNGAVVKKIGLNALVNNNGFRNDGSYYYGKIIEERLKSKNPVFTEEFDKIKNQDKLYKVDGGVNLEAVAKIEDFLKKSQARGIYVVGFMPPYAPSVYNKLTTRRENYGYIFKSELVLEPLFKKYGFHLFNFSDASVAGSSDEEMIDGIHGSEKTELRILIEMAKTDRVLSSYIDIDYLKKTLEMTHSLQVF